METLVVGKQAVVRIATNEKTADLLTIGNEVVTPAHVWRVDFAGIDHLDPNFLVICMHRVEDGGRVVRVTIYRKPSQFVRVTETSLFEHAEVAS